jgi:hypothetical protein
MHAVSVRNVSSFWPAASHANETLCPLTMPANQTVDDLGCGYPQWHPFQITGRQSTRTYGDSSYAWCPSSRTGTRGYDQAGDEYLHFASDPARTYVESGYTEFIEVNFATAVYAQSVEIGEPSGMGSIVRIKALDALTGGWFTMWEAPDGEGDPRVQYRGRRLGQYRVFKPNPMCSTTFRTETIRVEMDTCTVPDWNELDFITLKGSLALPRGVLPFGTREILYVPDPDAFGEDRFSYTLSDCASEPGRQPLPATVAVAIFAENDSPVAANYTMPDLASQQADTYHRSRRVDLAEFVVDVDGDEPIYSVDQIWGNITALLENGFLTL